MDEKARVTERKSISIRGLTMDRLKILAKREGLSVSALVEDIVEEDLRKQGRGRQSKRDALLELVEFVESSKFELDVPGMGRRSVLRADALAEKIRQKVKECE